MTDDSDHGTLSRTELAAAANATETEVDHRRGRLIARARVGPDADVRSVYIAHLTRSFGVYARPEAVEALGTSA